MNAPELQLFTDALERFCDTEIEPHYRDWEKAGQVPRELFTRMGAQGYLCADAEQYGSSGASVHFSFAVIEVLSRRGYGGFVGGLQVHNDIIPPHLLHCGTEAQRQHWLPRMASGEAIAAIGTTEPGAGSDLIRTTARKDGDHYVINGSKIFASNGQELRPAGAGRQTDPTAGAKGEPVPGGHHHTRLCARARTWKRSASTRATPRSCSSPTCACR